MADKVVAIVQARLGSTRLPNKVLKTINGKSLIEILLNRLSKSEKIDQKDQIILFSAHRGEVQKPIAMSMTK